MNELLQLPSYILFQEGKEQKRLPPLNSRKEPVKTFIDRRGISAYFALDKIFLKAKRSSSSKFAKHKGIQITTQPLTP